VSSASIFVVGLGVVLALPLVARGVRRQFDPFEPIVIFALAWGVMFIARPAVMLVHGRLSWFGVDLRPTLPLALFLAFSGGVAFVCGYELGVGRVLAGALPRPREISTRAGVVGALVMIGLAVTAFLVIVWPAGGYRRFTILFAGAASDTADTREVGRLLGAHGSYPLLTMMLLVPAALILLALALRERKAALAAAAALTFAAALAITVPRGARSFVLPLVGGGVTLLYLRRDTRPRFVSVVALAFFSSWVLVNVREPHARAAMASKLAGLVRHPETVFSPVVDGEDAEMAPVLAGALRVVPSRFHYRYGGALIGGLVERPIPRQLWPGKPQPSSTQIASTTWPSLVKDGFKPAFSPLLVFYWDFGVAGVLAGMAVFGIACRTLYEWFLRHRASIAAQMIFSIALWFVVPAVRNDPVDTIVFACFLVLPLVLLERWSSVHWGVRHPDTLTTRPRASQK
jgi:hypothetical protein